MIPRQHVIQCGNARFWTGDDWGAVTEAMRMTMGEAVGVMERLAEGSPAALHLVKDYGTPTECVICTA